MNKPFQNKGIVVQNLKKIGKNYDLKSSAMHTHKFRKPTHNVFWGPGSLHGVGYES